MKMSSTSLFKNRLGDGRPREPRSQQWPGKSLVAKRIINAQEVADVSESAQAWYSPTYDSSK
jgi:hypothetical protein